MICVTLTSNSEKMSELSESYIRFAREFESLVVPPQDATYASFYKPKSPEAVAEFCQRKPNKFITRILVRHTGELSPAQQFAATVVAYKIVRNVLTKTGTEYTPSPEYQTAANFL